MPQRVPNRHQQVQYQPKHVRRRTPSLHPHKPSKRGAELAPCFLVAAFLAAPHPGQGHARQVHSTHHPALQVRRWRGPCGNQHEVTGLDEEGCPLSVRNLFGEGKGSGLRGMKVLEDRQGRSPIFCVFEVCIGASLEKGLDDGRHFWLVHSVARDMKGCVASTVLSVNAGLDARDTHSGASARGAGAAKGGGNGGVV